MTETPDQTTSVTPSTTPAPAATPSPAAPTAPASGKTTEQELAEARVELERTKSEYQGYKEKADPVLETLWSDQELLAQATKVHNKRLGIAIDDKPTSTPNTSSTSADSDTRLALVDRTQRDFEAKAGIDKLPVEKQKEVRGLVGQMLKEMLDPKGNKTVSQIFQEVSLVKLPWYMEKAYQLVNRDNDLVEATNRGKSEVLSQYEGDRGMMGAVAGGSLPPSEGGLTPKERQVARNMGITEEEYLQNKKEMNASREND